MRAFAFFALCLIVSLLCTTPIALAIDAAGISPLAHPPFMAGMLAMTLSAVGVMGSLFKWF